MSLWISFRILQFNTIFYKQITNKQAKPISLDFLRSVDFFPALNIAELQIEVPAVYECVL